MSDKNIVNISTGNKFVAFGHLFNFLCARDHGIYNYSATGVGWTLHDSVFAVSEDSPANGDYVVVKSVGSSGLEDLYYKIELSANYIKITGWLYWNNTTHTGVIQYNTSSNWTHTDATASRIWIYANLDEVKCISVYAGVYYSCLFGGSINTPYDNTVEQTSSGVSSGSGVTIPLTSPIPVSWFVGQRIFIRDHAACKIITIASIGTNQITADLANNFASGAKLTAGMMYYCQSGNQLTNFAMLIGNSGANAVNSGLSALPGWCSNAHPDNLNSDYIPSRVRFTDATNIKYGGYIGNMFMLGTGIASEIPLSDYDGNGYRVFTLYGAGSFAIKEV